MKMFLLLPGVCIAAFALSPRGAVAQLPSSLETAADRIISSEFKAEHLGGFMSHAMHPPTEKFFAVALYHFREPSKLSEFLSGELAALAVGKPFDVERTFLDETVLRSYAVVYSENVVNRI